jgi:hypothetical protein
MEEFSKVMANSLSSDALQRRTGNYITKHSLSRTNNKQPDNRHRDIRNLLQLFNKQRKSSKKTGGSSNANEIHQRLLGKLLQINLNNQ